MAFPPALRALLSVAVVTVAPRAAAAPDRDPGREAELIALSDAWIAAEVHHDRAALERLLDEHFLATRASGRTIDRETFIAGILAAELKPFTVVNEHLVLHGETAVVVSTTADHALKFTWIAMRRDGRWRVISETFTKVAPPP